MRSLASRCVVGVGCCGFLMAVWGIPWGIPWGNLTKNYGKSPFLMGKSTISMAMFSSYVSHYQRVYHGVYHPTDEVG